MVLLTLSCMGSMASSSSAGGAEGAKSSGECSESCSEPAKEGIGEVCGESIDSRERSHAGDDRLRRKRGRTIGERERKEGG